MRNDNKNNDGEGGIATRMTNPGIIDRLEQDIQDYLHEFGFRIERECNDDNDVDYQTPLKDTAVIYIPTLPYSYSVNTTDEGTPTIITNTQSISGPVGTLHLHIQNESLLPTIGPLLRTLLRLAVHIPPQSLRAILYCDFVLDPLHKLSKMSALQQREHLEQQEEIAARKMVNAVHMLVRNSMGSALCLDVAIVLPCYWRRRKSDGGADVDEGRKSLPISKLAVEQAMEGNCDACYPSIHLEERVDNEIVFSSCDNGIDSGSYPSSIRLTVSTRMCTVRHQPLLFRWVSQIGSDHSVDATETVHSILPLQTRLDDHKVPLIVACIEKPGNLHRILMLCYQYRPRFTSVLSNLIVVMPDDGERSGLKQLFQEAIDHFCRSILNQDGTYVQDSDEGCLSTLSYEGDAVSLIRSRLQHEQDGRTSSTPQEPSIIGIDLHPNALTLSGSDYACQAQAALVNANAIIFGYESTGIPQNIDEILNSWVQIPSRSSINLVAAMSIIFDVMMNTL
mmetsp:Transcript_4881/g.8330  ORF Transcript_4881/g.8330 Transcript_4881/m.8330 type:complete len:507 (-) Transcript_4881:744-2264(-)